MLRTRKLLRPWKLPEKCRLRETTGPGVPGPYRAVKDSRHLLTRAEGGKPPYKAAFTQIM